MEKYKYYKRKVNYYETDKMSVVHHSNYARYLEECRIDMLDYYGLPFEKLEEMGYMIPVLELYSQFKESIRFGETILVIPKLEKVTPVKFYFSYEIYDESMSSLKHIAQSVHCFLDSEFRPVSLKKKAPELYEKLISMQEQ